MIRKTNKFEFVALYPFESDKKYVRMFFLYSNYIMFYDFGLDSFNVDYYNIYGRNYSQDHINVYGSKLMIRNPSNSSDWSSDPSWFIKYFGGTAVTKEFLSKP